MDYQTTPATAEELEAVAESDVTFVYPGERIVGKHAHPKREGGGVPRAELDALAQRIEKLEIVNPGAPINLKPLTDRVETLEKKKEMTLAADPKKPGAIITKTPGGYTIGLDL